MIRWRISWSVVQMSRCIASIEARVPRLSILPPSTRHFLSLQTLHRGAVCNRLDSPAFFLFLHSLHFGMTMILGTANLKLRPRPTPIRRRAARGAFLSSSPSGKPRLYHAHLGRHLAPRQRRVQYLWVHAQRHARRGAVDGNLSRIAPDLTPAYLAAFSVVSNATLCSTRNE
ncbi:hypothetical protein C8J57DRAFT_1724986 [Mycena rebaudengoi]|nr:hypothetical protein C8J57DRAFT_1724986 [Mycena rebaudengoi]